MTATSGHSLQEGSTILSSRDNQLPYAIVIGLDGMNGLQTARILANRGVLVIAIAMDPKHYCCRTKVCEKILFADTTSEEFIGMLEALGSKLEQKAVLFPCNDMEVRLISRHRQSLEKWYHLTLPPPDVVEMMMDKFRFYSFAQQEGFPIPRTIFLHNENDVKQVAKELTFPCLLKPPISATPEWEQKSKLKAYKLENEDELFTIYNRFKTLADVLIVQEWIPGPNANLYSCNCYFDADSNPIVTFVARKLRQWPPETGESSLGVECRDDVVLHEALRLFKSVNYHGLGYVELKCDERSGKYYILEPNIGRPTGRSAIAEAGGVELLYTMYCDSIGLPLPENREQKYGDVKWIYLRRDFQSALYYMQRGELTLRDWWRSWCGRKTYALFSWTDPGPFLGDLGRCVRLFLSPQERKKRDYRNPLVD